MKKDDQNTDSEQENIDDVTIEEGVDENGDSVGASNPAATIKKLREKLKIATEEKQQTLAQWQRDRADFINSKKRDEETRKELVKFATEDLIAELIPALDSFDMAMGNKEAWEKADKNWRVGVEYIYSQLLGALEKNGLKQDNPLGKPFDANHHEPIESVKTDKKEDDGMIVQVIQKGYSLNGKDVRPAKVKVGECEVK